MAVRTLDLHLRTRGQGHLVDVTDLVREAVAGSGLVEGHAVLFVPGATAALTTIEHEPGLVRDFGEMMDRLIPPDRNYHHDERWSDGNGHSHLRASTIGPSLVVPFRDGKLLLGTWQQIVFCDFDVGPRSRTLHCQLCGQTRDGG